MLRQLGASRVRMPRETVGMGILEFLRLSAFETVEGPVGEGAEAQQARAFLEDLKALRVDAAPDVQGLRSELRPYQQAGLSWLWFLYHYQLSGLLCDDMGLGKTHQAMAMMAAARNAKGLEERRKHFLVVCPTSVIYHWQEKLARFLPDLKVCVFHGPQRSLDGFLLRYDVLLTSYGILRREREILSVMGFDLAIFDEVQVAKNHASKLHSALLKIRARMRLGLTGTPIRKPAAGAQVPLRRDPAHVHA